jgi:kynurenine formamidase
MHNTTHIDAPAHVVQGTPFIDEVPLPHFFGSGIVVSIPKKKWEQITYEDLEKAAGQGRAPARRRHRQHRLAQALRG